MEKAAKRKERQQSVTTGEEEMGRSGTQSRVDS